MADWVRQKSMHTQPVQIDGSNHGGGGGGGGGVGSHGAHGAGGGPRDFSDFDDDHSSECVYCVCAQGVLDGVCAGERGGGSAWRKEAFRHCLPPRRPWPRPPPPPPPPPGTVHSGPDTQQLPFELVALEAALKEVINAAALQAKELEGVALPALDALTKSVSEREPGQGLAGGGWYLCRCGASKSASGSQRI